MSASRDEVPSALSEATNVLLLAPALGRAEADACADLLSLTPGPELDLLCVTFTDTPDERLNAWRTHADGSVPAKMSVVTVGDQTRSAAVSANGTMPFVTHAVSEPANLTKLGVRVTEQLADWDGDGNRTVLDFDSLTALLQYAPRNRVFQFMHVLRGRLDSNGATAHYHMDPSVHDDQTVNTFKSLMDAVVEIDDEGERSVSTS